MSEVSHRSGGRKGRSHTILNVNRAAPGAGAYDDDTTVIQTFDVLEHDSLSLKASCTGAGVSIKVEHREHPNDPNWEELVATTVLAAGAAPTMLYRDLIRTGQIRVQAYGAGATLILQGLAK